MTFLIAYLALSLILTIWFLAVLRVSRMDPPTR